MKSKPEDFPQKKSKRLRIGLFIVFVMVAIAVVATIALPRNSSQAAPKKYKAMKETIRDTATGTLRKPTPEETDAMVTQIASLTNRSTAGLTSTQTANGTRMDLDGRFGGVVLGRATADGGTEVRCVFTLEEAADFLGLEETE